jgi:hypothetical protein
MSLFLDQLANQLAKSTLPQLLPRYDNYGTFSSYDTLIPYEVRPDVLDGDDIRCEFVRYKDQYVCEIIVYRLWVCAYNMFIDVNDPVNGDHYIYTSLDLEAVTGVSDITSVLPLGVL